jgi:hypothetical protein
MRVDYSDYVDFEDSCFDWKVQQIFDYTNRNLIKMTLNLQSLDCDAISNLKNKPISAAVSLSVLLLSLFSLILTTNYFLGIVKMYNQIRQEYLHNKEKIMSMGEQHVRLLLLNYLSFRNLVLQR